MAGCSSDTSAKPTPAGDATTFASVSSIIRTDCATAGCHPTYTTQTVFDAEASEALGRIQRAKGVDGAMPKNWNQSTSYSSTANGLALKRYLESVAN
jgi:hypothetical protein